MSYSVGVFISHSWTYTDHYKTLADWLFNSSWNVSGTPLVFADFSIPEHDPIHNANNEYELGAAIAGELAKAHIVVCPTGMYANHSKWIEKELAGAENMRRKILGVDPWGQQRTSSIVQDRADKVVGWNKNSVVNGAWSLFKGM